MWSNILLKFSYAFPWWLVMLNTFPRTVGHRYIFCGKMSVQYLFAIEFMRSLYFFYIKSMVCNYFFPFHKLPLHCIKCFFCCVGDFQFDIIPLIYFCDLCFVGIFQKTIAKTNIKEFSLLFCVFQVYVLSL